MLSRHALSDRALSELTCRLWYANVRYTRVASELRRQIPLTRTHHAKRRAFLVGLRVDIEKAKGCPMTTISVRHLPLLDTTSSPSPNIHSFCGSAIEPCNQLGLEIPQSIVPSHTTDAHPHERLIIRIPPLASIYDDMPRYEQLDMTAPGAPLIRTKDLPEDSDMEDICSSGSPSSVSSLSPLTPIDIVYSGLRIKIPTRKRKLTEPEDSYSSPDSSDTQFPKKHLRRRWARSQTANGQTDWPPFRSHLTSC